MKQRAERIEERVKKIHSVPPEAYTDENFFKKCEMEFNSLKKDTMVQRHIPTKTSLRSVKWNLTP
ncbi:hypothetical protein AYO24_10355 (plasmid) [Coxiella burnetii]|nr:hypothetical protein AYO24_10355 [Coxiella burnetii]